MAAVPLGYASACVYAVGRFEWGFPTLQVSREGWNIKVTMSIEVENLTSISVPSLEAYVNVTLNGNVLFHGESEIVGSLNAHSSATITLTTTVNLDLLADLFWTLVDYLSGKPVTLYGYFRLSVNLIRPWTLSQHEITRVYQL